MIETIISGIGLGLGLAIMMGPAFFSLLQTSIDRGFRNAVRFAVGIFLSDTFLVSIAFLGAASVLGKPMIKELVGLVGGGMLVGMGIHTFLNRGKRGAQKVDAEIEIAAEIDEIISPQLPKPIIFFGKGFLLNLANPATWFFWIFWVGVVSSQYADSTGHLDKLSLFIFFSSTLIAVLATDVLKAYVAHQLKSRINDKFISKMNMVFGLILIAFGIFLVARSIYPIIQFMHINLIK